ncbi:hypothetical protein B0T18DRAFT_322389 [Schizothecium vesticola]|uniref:Uncharacterized protein n=1 Tax=Schizothecium vesticola TaxID=314040 RepID=A0AA40F0K3_9PEZI|nr:hypothetical protein B0T18DRAFT_322389 [Schizothecium vesticola]
MCDYAQREYKCGHFRWIASRWCLDYTMSQKRCPPNVVYFEVRPSCLRALNPCGECLAKTNQVPWESMIRRPENRTRN